MSDKPDDDVKAALEAARWRYSLRRGPEEDAMSEAMLVRPYALRQMHADPAACRRCLGGGLVVKTELGKTEPWLRWALLPPNANLAVISGNVRPMICRDCRGTGEQPTEDIDDEIESKPNDVPETRG